MARSNNRCITAIFDPREVVSGESRKYRCLPSSSQGFETSVLRGVSESVVTVGSSGRSCCSEIEGVGDIHIEMLDEKH